MQVIGQHYLHENNQNACAMDDIKNSLHTDNNEGNNALFIGFNISAKFSYRVDNDNSKNGRYRYIVHS